MAVLVVGLGVTGEAVARRLAVDGPVTVVDDDPASGRFAERAAGLEALGVRVVGAPRAGALADLVAAADLVVPSPGVPEAHPVYGLAGLALLTNTQLLLPIIGGLFVLETVSVVIQVISFRGFKRRVFRMAPIHHHFELAGWPEFTVIVRFWLIAGLFVAFGLGLFYADFIRIPGALD